MAEGEEAAVRGFFLTHLFRRVDGFTCGYMEKENCIFKVPNLEKYSKNKKYSKLVNVIMQEDTLSLLMVTMH